MFGGYACAYVIMHVIDYRDFPSSYCVQHTEKIWTHEEDDLSSCIAVI